MVITNPSSTQISLQGSQVLWLSKEFFAQIKCSPDRLLFILFWANLVALNSSSKRRGSGSAHLFLVWKRVLDHFNLIRSKPIFSEPA